MSSERSFASLYSHGFARVAAAVPHMRIGEPAFNAERTLALARRASEDDAALIAFPELGLSGYSIDDLLHQGALLDGVIEAIERIAAESVELPPMLVVGAPLRCEHGLFNCGVVIHRGRVLGVIPKSYLPEYREYYEKRQFRAARDAVGRTIRLLGSEVPFGPDLLFCQPRPAGLRGARRDLRGRVGPDSAEHLRRAGRCHRAGQSVGQQHHDRQGRFSAHAVRVPVCAAIAAYVYTAAGMGESTTDLAWDGQALIFENGDLLAEAERFSTEEELIACDIDLDRLVSDRASTSSYGDSIHDFRDRLVSMRRIELDVGCLRAGRWCLCVGMSSASPTCRPTLSVRNERCEEVYNIQVRGLETRLQATGIEKIVIGVSGGLDSTHALIVAARAMDRLGLPRSNILAYTMPGFATGEHTLRNAHRLMKALGVSASELDIRPAASQMLQDLGHPAAEGADQYDVTYENVQAGRAHLAPVPPGQLPPWARPRHRRPVRAGPRLGHLRRRRPDVPLPRQRLGAQDADPVHGPLGDRHRPVRRRRRTTCSTRC